MNVKDKKCAICDGLLVKGFMMDVAGAIMDAPSRWIEGEPERTAMGWTAFNDRPNFLVRVFRCETCGHLELYAINKPSFKPG